MYDSLIPPADAIPDPDAALRQAAQFGDLAYVLVLVLFLIFSATMLIIWKAVIPWVQAKQERENRIADSQAEHLKLSGDNQTKLTVTIEKLVPILTDVRGEVRDGFEHVHKRLDGLWVSRRSDDPSQSPLPRS